ncbi:amidase [Bradyrhizobium sp. LHD-71]|uniref:amidase n=1 Tax=Bradyrhizobium sp. LHD-71 TaxID=3072141 RepID=UPI00280C61AE|nr:amidase [Bradyrhizobium sp. LHD-71]MDQ8727867.1 amidase [Bradyrhizobium sp. LHD-71]
MTSQILTIAEASRLIRDRKLSPVELTRDCLARIAKLDGRLHSFILLLADEALAQARQAEAEIAAGRWRGPLHGIPFGLKDIVAYKGHPTTAHSALLEGRVSPEDAFVTARLRESGVVFLGKLATWEFAVGGPSHDLPWPPARNPWNTEHDPAGSSSGSAAAVAAGLCLGALGTDTGGSVRSPASLCGIAGHKPTYGLVSRRGVLPLSFSLDHVGPMCWTTEDCALVLKAIAGHDPLDIASARTPMKDPVAGLGGGLKGVRIGVIRNFHEKDFPATTEVVAAFDQSIAVLKGLGASVRDVSLSPLQAFQSAGLLISRSDAFAIHGKTLRESPHLYGAIGRRRILAGAFAGASDYVNAQRQRVKLTAEVANVMNDVDILVCPTSREAAPKLGDYAQHVGGNTHYCRPFNLTGQPALSVCNGFSNDGLPLSLQIAGRHFEDDLVLHVGDAYEKATAFREQRPKLVEQRQAAAE